MPGAWCSARFAKVRLSLTECIRPVKSTSVDGDSPPGKAVTLPARILDRAHQRDAAVAEEGGREVLAGGVANGRIRRIRIRAPAVGLKRRPGDHLWRLL